MLTRFVRLHVDELSEHVSAQALVRPDGVVGTTAAGSYTPLDRLYPVEVLTDLSRALSWLGIVDLFPAMAEVEEHLNGFFGTYAMLSELRASLNRSPGSTSLKKLAAALGMSRRALQRRLRELNTTFRTEHNAAQVHVAKDLLRNTNYDIKRIAFEVGCASAAGFSVLFRRLEGQSPSDWRDLHAPMNGKYAALRQRSRVIPDAGDPNNEKFAHLFQVLKCVDGGRLR